MSSLPESAERETPVDRPPEAVAAAERYVGLVTRVIAFVLDAALIRPGGDHRGGWRLADRVGVASPGGSKTILEAIAGAASILWSIGYFVVFWSTTGQTPGSRAMQIRVVSASGGRIKPHRAIVRCVGLVLAALPLFAGYLLILLDGKRRGFQDRFAGTLVVEAPQLARIGARRASKRAAYEGSRRRPPALSP